MADYTNWLKRCIYRNYMGQELSLYQGEGPGQTSFLFYGRSDTDEEMLADCFLRYGGNYGQKVEWLYKMRGQILISKWKSGLDENTLVLEGLGAGADDVRFGDDDLVEVVTKPTKLQQVVDILELEDIPFLWAGNILVPRDFIPVQNDEVITNILSLLDEITAIESIVNLSADFWILDERLEKLM